jgi:hypothetical protein
MQKGLAVLVLRLTGLLPVLHALLVRLLLVVLAALLLTALAALLLTVELNGTASLLRIFVVAILHVVRHG